MMMLWGLEGPVGCLRVMHTHSSLSPPLLSPFSIDYLFLLLLLRTRTPGVLMWVPSNY